MDNERSSATKPQQLADMLGIGLEAGQANQGGPNELTAELLRNKLDGPLPPDPAAVAKLPSILDNIYKELVPGGRRSLGEALAEPKTDINTIVRIKDHAKQTAAPDCPEPQRTVSVTVYYTAIASALIFHDRKITTYSYDTVAVAFAKLLDKPWIPLALSEHLKTARRICLDRGDQSQ